MGMNLAALKYDVLNLLDLLSPSSNCMWQFRTLETIRSSKPALDNADNRGKIVHEHPAGH